MLSVVSSDVNVFQKLENSTQSAYFGLNSSGSFVVQTSGSSFSDKLTIESGGATTFGSTSSATSTGASIQHLSNGFLYVKGGVGGIVIGDDSTTSRMQIYDNSDIVFETAGSEAMRISSGGDTTITTTTNQGGLTITSATDNTTLRLINTATSGKDWRLYSTGGSSGLGAGKLFIKVGTTETSARLVSFVDDGSNINVGIGDILPTAKLQIHTETNAGGAEVAAFLVNNSSTINTEVRLAFAANTNDDISTGRYSYISAKNTSGINGQDLVFATNATGASATPKLTISSGGAATFSSS